MEKLIKEVRFLKLYSAMLTLVCCLLFFFAFKPNHSKQRFEEIDVERINIVEKDGSLKMVISNKQRQHPGMFNGKSLKPRTREAGMIFFNELGDECGGLVYDGNDKESAMVYSVDQRNTDQIMQLQYLEGAGEHKYRTYGLKLWDRSDDFPIEAIMKFEDSLKALKDTAATRNAYAWLRAQGKLAQERLFAGKLSNGEVGLFLRDDKGRVRLKIYVGKDNQAHIEQLDETGQLIGK